MVKLQIRYEIEKEKDKIIKILLKTSTIKKISKPAKSGRYYRVYLDVE